MARTHIFFTDTHCLPGESNDHAIWLGRLINDVKPDVVVNGGDHADMPSLCVSEDTKILTGALTWVEAGDIQIGDDVIGFNSSKKTGRKLWKHSKGKVTQNKKFSAKGIKVFTSRGDITVTPDHKFLAQVVRPGGYKDTKKWVQAKDLTNQHEIFFFEEPWEVPSTLEAGYIRGFLDGEGSFSGGRLSWSQLKTIVADDVEAIISKHGFEVKNYVEEKERKKPLFHYYLGRNWQTTFKALGIFRPIRLLEKALKELDGKALTSYNRENAKVLSVNEIPSADFVAIETTCRTYISNGFYSHNCSYDKGTRAAVGRSYRADVDASVDFHDRLWSTVKRAKKRLPKRYMLIGNHEQRIERALDLHPHLEGTISLDDLEYGSFYDEVIGYEGGTPGIKEIDGVYYAHYFVSGVMGHPIGGDNQSATLINKKHASCSCGHSHLRDFAERSKPDGSKAMALVGGHFTNYEADWAGVRRQLWLKGLTLKREVENGEYDLQWISLSALEKEYGDG